MKARRRYTARDLLTIAKRRRLPIKQNGGHIRVTLPDGTYCTFYPRGPHDGNRHVDVQTKRFRVTGLLEES